MKNLSASNSVAAASLLALFFLIFSSCAALRPPMDPALDAKAQSMAEKLYSFNRHIKTAKGTAWGKLTTPEKTTRYKMAWAAAFPNKLRLTLMLSGMPVETIITDGRNLSFISHTGKHKDYTFRTKDPDFGFYIDIPVKASELILLLLGRYPVTGYNNVFFDTDDPSLSTLVLTRKWSLRRLFICMDSTGLPHQLWTETEKQNTESKIKIINHQNYSGQLIPGHLELLDDQSIVKVDIISFIANPPIKESVFRLTPKGS